MAANQVTGGDAIGRPNMDYPAHLATYQLFTSLVKWGTILVILALVLLAFLTL